MIKPLIRSFSAITPTMLVLAVVGWFLYAPAFHAPFVFDDLPQIIENPHIRITGYSSDIPARLMNCRNPNRFLAYATFALNYYVHQYDVAGYRVVNVVIHIITAFLVFLTARLTLDPGGRKRSVLLPLLAAALWLVNPVHTQSVTYIVQRMNAMAAMFTLLALCCFVRARLMQRSGKHGLKPILLYAGVGFSGLCGLAAKETAAILPVVMLLYEWYFFQDLDHNWMKKQLAWISAVLVLLVIISLVYMGGHPVDKLTGMYGSQDFTPGQRLLTEPRVVLYYLTLLFFPHPTRLNLDYNFPLSLSLLNPATTLPAILALLGLVVAAAYTAKKHRLCSFAIAWFLVTLVIESSFIGLALVFEHRTYLPSVFPVIAVTCFLVRRVKPLPVGVMIVIAAIILCGYNTYQRNRVWDNALAFWQDNVRKSPDKALSNNNLGLVYKEIGALDKAMFYSKKALMLKTAEFGETHPEVADSLSNVGLVYYRQGEYDKALSCHLKALAIQKAAFGQYDHRLLEIYSNIGIAYDGKGDFDKAIHYYRLALDLERGLSEMENLRSASIYNNLGSVWYNKGNHEKAIAGFKQSLAIRKKVLGDRCREVAESYNNLGLAHAGMGDYRTALSYYQQALDIELEVLGVHHYSTTTTFFNLGLTCYAREDYDKAAFYMQKVLVLYRETLGRNHPWILTAQSILDKALMKSNRQPSSGGPSAETDG